MIGSMKSYDQDKTIAAIATPPGEGGVAIIRISGKEALPMANLLLIKDIFAIPSHTARFAKIYHPTTKEVVDEGIFLIMRGPNSYTGEDVVEIHCHGGALISKRVLEAAFAAGAHPAAPGEFTYRAFCSSKLDLVQAEAVQALIGAKSERALAEAEKQLDGRLSILIKDLQQSIIDVTAIIEAWVDYPEEGLEFASNDEMREMLNLIQAKMETLTDTFYDGKRISSTIGLCLAGSPNVGKSSLMNALVGHDRAIVTHVPGTTRDLLAEEIHINDLLFTLIDTAGIRQTNEIVEKEGIKRSQKSIQQADIILYVLDITTPLTPDQQETLDTLPKEKTLLIFNKSDLSPSTKPTLPFPHQIEVSAKTHTNIDTLKSLICTLALQTDASEKSHVVITKERHFLALKKALSLIEKTLDGFNQNISPEFLAFDLRTSLKHLSEIIGQDITEEVLGSIFSKFCVGK
ncbi:MAG: tRNA modification GTPase MnmE [Chlamydiia bacterium]|nr:tRNA modification GTPase MnmE [Chlamydiia bacterium]